MPTQGSKEKMSEHQLEEHRLKEQQRIKAYRSKQSMKPTSSTASTTDLATPHRSRQALGKAMKRLEHSLPSSPRKQHFVVGKLARSVGLSVSSSSKKSISAESEAKRELVHTFTELMMYHGKLLERKTASSFVKQQRQERGSSKLSKSAT